jgi:hypothetical protein
LLHRWVSSKNTLTFFEGNSFWLIVLKFRSTIALDRYSLLSALSRLLNWLFCCSFRFIVFLIALVCICSNRWLCIWFLTLVKFTLRISWSSLIWLIFFTFFIFMFCCHFRSILVFWSRTLRWLQSIFFHLFMYKLFVSAGVCRCRVIWFVLLWHCGWLFWQFTLLFFLLFFRWFFWSILRLFIRRVLRWSILSLLWLFFWRLLRLLIGSTLWLFFLMIIRCFLTWLNWWILIFDFYWFFVVFFDIIIIIVLIFWISIVVIRFFTLRLKMFKLVVFLWNFFFLFATLRTRSFFDEFLWLVLFLCRGWLL